MTSHFKAESMTRLILLRPHTHAGKALSPGDALDLPTPTADWLIAHGIARAAEDTPAAARFPLEKEHELPDGVATATAKTSLRNKDTKP